MSQARFVLLCTSFFENFYETKGGFTLFCMCCFYENDMQSFLNPYCKGPSYVKPTKGAMEYTYLSFSNLYVHKIVFIIYYCPSGEHLHAAASVLRSLGGVGQLAARS